MNGAIKRENFSLAKLKVLKGGGIESTVKVELTMDGSFMEIERNQKTPIIPHPDLLTPIEGMKEYLLISCGFMGVRTMVNGFEFHATNKQKEATEKYVDLLKGKTTVTGVHISGQDQNEGVIITGKIQAENGSNIAINSPRIRFRSEVFGFEDDLEGQIHVIETEAYLYLQENKKAQLDAFTEDEQKG